MNKYILMLGIAGVVLGSYAAYAGNSATMTVTATIAHDVSLSVTQDLDLGTIVIDPSQNTGRAAAPNDNVYSVIEGGIISVSGGSDGLFTANVPSEMRARLSVENSECKAGVTYLNMQGIKACFSLYPKSDNTYVVYAEDIYYDSLPSDGVHSGTITIRYTPES
ncbi:MAG: hypothetical protein IJ689_06120 [Alphaproteobacteria bacterium]|nr:hypothetical protein [Alphaproteobacteria bacterium]